MIRRYPSFPWLRSIALLVALLAAVPTHAEARYASAEPGEKKSEAYREGQEALEDEEWDEASEIFARIAAKKGSEAEAAMYWKAYADWKLQRNKESLETLRKLASTYPDGPWLDDAKALEAEIRGSKKASRSEETSDEDLKLYALDGLMQIDSEKALPVLRKLLAGDASRKVKERALFVLSQSDSPAARETLMQVVRTGEPIGLRCQAIRTIGISAEEEDFAALRAIASDSKAPEEVRNAVVEAFMISGRGDELAAIALSDPDPRVRGKAIESLGAMGETGELRALWAKEKDPNLRRRLLEAYGIAGDVDALTEAAKSSDGDIRRKAIEGLAICGSPDANRALKQLYAKSSDPDDKRKILEAFMISGDAKTLVELFRTEPDRDLKKKILQQLSMMDDEEANRVILEVLGEKP